MSHCQLSIILASLSDELDIDFSLKLFSLCLGRCVGTTIVISVDLFDATTCIICVFVLFCNVKSVDSFETIGQKLFCTEYLSYKYLSNNLQLFKYLTNQLVVY